MLSLRPYQTRAVEALRGHMRGGKRRLLLVAATGSGKTVIAAEIVRRALARGTRVLFAAHRRELITQCARKLADAGIRPDEIGIIMAGFHPHPECPVQVASVDTLRNRERPPAGLLIIDESHRCLAPTYRALVSHYAASGAAILGLTATPYRADGGGLGDVYEVLEVVSTPTELITDGFLVAPRCLSIPQGKQPDLRGVRVRGGDYVESELAKAMDKTGLVGDIVEHWRTHAEDRRTVAFASSVAHSQHIAEGFVAAGVAAEHLDGETPASERDAILSRLESGKTKVVANCNVLCEGWDQPAVKCCISARPTKSMGLWLQQAGRILRPWQGVGALILDHAGNALVHGLPQETRQFTLLPTASKLAKKRTTKQCPACQAICPVAARTCPECGHTFVRASVPIEENVGGQLEEVNPNAREAMIAYWKSLVAEWQRFNEHCDTRNKEMGEKIMAHRKPGWIWHRWKSRYECRPPNGCVLPLEHASEAIMRQALREFRSTAQAKNYKAGWVYFRFTQRFGEAAWAGMT